MPFGSTFINRIRHLGMHILVATKEDYIMVLNFTDPFPVSYTHLTLPTILLV